MRDRFEVQAVIRHKNTYLIVQKSESPNWRLVKGGIEESEEHEAALRREVAEETGLSNITVQQKVHAYSFQPKSINHIVTSYLVEVDDAHVALLDGELAAFKWVPFEEAEKKLIWPHEKIALRNAHKLL